MIAFAQKTLAGGNLTSKLHVIEVGATPGTPPVKRNAELFFPPEFADDFPVAMQISEKYGLVYVITKLGLLFVYDLETATAVYRNRISPDPIFLTSNAPDTGGFYAINRRGQVQLVVLMRSRQLCQGCHDPHRPLSITVEWHDSSMRRSKAH